MNSVEEKLWLKMLRKLKNPCINVGENCAPIFNTHNSIKGVKCGTKKAILLEEVDEELLTCRDVDAAPMSKPRD